MSVKARLGVNAQGVEPLILFVQVDQGQRGPLPTPVHVHPFRGGQKDICLSIEDRILLNDKTYILSYIPLSAYPELTSNTVH